MVRVDIILDVDRALKIELRFHGIYFFVNKSSILLKIFTMIKVHHFFNMFITTTICKNIEVYQNIMK